MAGLRDDSRPMVVWSAGREYLAFVDGPGLETVLARRNSDQLRLARERAFLGERDPSADPGSGGMSDVPHSCDLSLLCGYLWVRCKHRACLEDIIRHFSCSRCTRVVSPDVVVECDWERAGRYLFRSRPASLTGALEGVRVLVAGRDTRLRSWTSHYPPLPPLDVPPFEGRFAGLHGAAVVAPDGGAILLLGDRESGKSTSAVDLVEHADCQLLTDETVFLHRRTLLAEPFPIAIGIRRSADQPGKDLVPASEAVRSVSARPALVARVIILNPVAARTRLVRLGEADALRELLRHHVDVGLDLNESLITLLRLASEAELSRFDYGSYDDLLRLRGLLFPS
jgi:hypothetical protein